VAFVIGLAVGIFVVGSRPPDLPAAASIIADGLRGSAQLLEVTQIEYEEAIKPGASEAEFDGSLENLDRARGRYEAISAALNEIDAPRVARINQGFDGLRGLMEERTEIAEVAAAITALRSELRPG
jgi:hypothetical protein